jgi:acetolactate synthase-1/2/3 large subunit
MADDTLRQKTRNAGVIAGAHPFADMLGGHGEEVRDPARIAGALQRAREAIHRTGRSAAVNIRVDPRDYAPGTKNPTMHK